MQNENKVTKIYLAADHAGFLLKEKVKLYLESNYSFEIADFGAHENILTDDYTKYMHQAGHKLSSEYSFDQEGNIIKNTKTFAFVFGGSGEGEAIVMNRYNNVRCTTYYGNNLDIIRLGRAHNNANAISFGARFVTYDECVKAIEIFLNTDFEKGRHISRIENIDHKIGFLGRFFN